jgi:hypothetical protein
MIAESESASSRAEEVGSEMTAEKGGPIVVESERVQQAARQGVIEELRDRDRAPDKLNYPDQYRIELIERR